MHPRRQWCLERTTRISRPDRRHGSLRRPRPTKGTGGRTPAPVEPRDLLHRVFSRFFLAQRPRQSHGWTLQDCIAKTVMKHNYLSMFRLNGSINFPSFFIFHCVHFCLVLYGIPGGPLPLDQRPRGCPRFLSRPFAAFMTEPMTSPSSLPHHPRRTRHTQVRSSSALHGCLPRPSLKSAGNVSLAVTLLLYWYLYRWYFPRIHDLPNRLRATPPPRSPPRKGDGRRSRTAASLHGRQFLSLRRPLIPPMSWIAR